MRKFGPTRLKLIEKEVAKLIKANAIRESHYPDWLANVVITPKKGKNGEYALISLISIGYVQKIIFLCPKLT